MSSTEMIIGMHACNGTCTFLEAFTPRGVFVKKKWALSDEN